tara:strand:- start:45 stop:749 length:705 start_codon:yes stop_codon:yes gene_type:complete
MSSIKLKHSGGNSVSLNPPSSAPTSSEVAFKLPNADGSADQIIKTDGSGNLAFGGSASPSQVLEEFCSPCDSSVITLSDGNHTLTGPTGSYDVTDTFTDIAGSSFTYTPPTGTEQVVYDFRFVISNDGGTDGGPLLNFKLLLDSDEVTKYRRVFRAKNSEIEYCVRWGFNIGGSADTTVGRVASWTSDKTIKVQVNRYSSDYPGVLHETNHWDAGGSTDQFNAPTLSVKAIGSI